MSICNSGINCKLNSSEIHIFISENHPLIRLANLIPWEELLELVLPDLKATTVLGKWWLGRKLKVRVHLGVYLLQQLFNKTDRQVEYDVKDNAAYQLFCGKDIVADFHVPDHTKIEEFRSRLSPQTQNALANKIAVLACKLGFADSSKIDVDSTVQKANMSYPSDVNLMVKLSIIANKVEKYLNEKVSYFLGDSLSLNLKAIKARARRCYFTKSKEDLSQMKLWQMVFDGVSKIRNKLVHLFNHQIKKMPWNIKRAMNQLIEYGQKYLLDVMHYLINGNIVKDKALSFHLKEVSCFNKGWLDKLEFGRQQQLTKLTGNFLVIGECRTVRLEDKHSVKPMVEQHKKLFGEDNLESITADKGYYSKANKEYLVEAGIKEIGLQEPGKRGSLPDIEDPKLKEELVNRRASIEPLIGHLKFGWQFGRSRMKTDKTIISSAYASVFGFNLRQLKRAGMGKIPKIAA
jgi:IS5 family transposase